MLLRLAMEFQLMSFRYLVGRKQIRINILKKLKHEFLHENPKLARRGTYSPTRQIQMGFAHVPELEISLPSIRSSDESAFPINSAFLDLK